MRDIYWMIQQLELLTVMPELGVARQKVPDDITVLLLGALLKNRSYEISTQMFDQKSFKEIQSELYAATGDDRINEFFADTIRSIRDEVIKNWYLISLTEENTDIGQVPLTMIGAKPVTFGFSDKYGYYTVPFGENHMDGETALWYSRSRYSTSDFDRTRRQQEVIMALFERILSLNGIEKAPELYNIYSENVTTNLTWQDFAPLVPLAAQLSDTSRIQHYYIGPAQVTSWTTPGGAQVLLPNYDAINVVLWQALYED